MRKEADRIWAVLDYVFEVPAHLDRDTKARMILTELRDKLNIYHDVRKTRAPTDMLERIGVTPPRRTDQQLSPVNVMGAASEPESSHSPEYQVLGVANGEMLYGPPALRHSPEGSTDSGGNPSLVSMPVPAGGKDNVMIDIDWVSSNQLDCPPFEVDSNRNLERMG